MTNHEQRRVVQAAYSALETGDSAKLLSVCTADVVWIYPGPETFVPVAGEFIGQVGVEEFFDLLNEDESIWELVPKELFNAHGDRMIVLGHYRCRITSTSREYETDFVHVFTLRDDRISRFQGFLDTAAELEAYGALVFP